MSDGIYVALSGAIAETTALDSTANNLANSSTDGYQALRPVFHEVLVRASTTAGDLRYSAVSATPIDPTAGGRRTTGRDLDAALPQGVYLGVSTAAGERYTRACSLEMRTDGTLQTRGGLPVAGEDGSPIHLPPTGGELSLSTDGAVLQNGTVRARLRLVSFTNPDQLVQQGSALLNAPAAAGTPTPATGTLAVGAVEESNASVVHAMTDLVTATRTFDAFKKVIDTFHDADRRVVETVPSAS